jgi:hypothetical protein
VCDSALVVIGVLPLIICYAVSITFSILKVMCYQSANVHFFLHLIGILLHHLQVDTIGRAVTGCSIRFWWTKRGKCYRVCFVKMFVDKESSVY